MPLCAYCKEPNKLTLEHIIPSFIYDFQKKLSNSVLGWNKTAGKMLGSEAKIKDVCEECNNVRLAKLDGEGKRLLVEAGVLTENFVQSSITLNYDFDKLARWILKISFNSSRTDGKHSHLFEPHIRYMLYGEGRVKRSQCALLAYFAAPELIGSSDRMKEIFTDVPEGTNVYNPFIVRICHEAATSDENYTVRMVIFGALVFYLLVFHENVLPGHASVAIKKFLKRNLGVAELTHKRRLIELRPGNRTWADLYQYQMSQFIKLGVKPG